MPEYEFTPSFGNRPTHLVGRKQIIGQILGGLNSNVGNKGRSIVILGQRGNGKTVLLWEIADQARERGFVVANPTSVREGFLERVVEKLQEDGERALGHHKAQINGAGFGAFGFSANLQFLHGEQIKSSEQRLTVLCRELTRHHLGALILVDELQANDAEVRRLVATYQELVGERLDVALVLAGLPGCVSATLNDRVLTFLNRARKISLEPLAIGDVDAFYRKAFRADGIQIDAAIRREAAAATGGSPYLMQLIGYYLLAYSDANDVVDRDTLAEALQSAQDEFENDVCATTLFALSPKDREYLRCMAELGGTSRTADIAARMGVTPDYGQQYRRRLLDAGVIETTQRGIVRFAVPYLADYLLKS